MSKQAERVEKLLRLAAPGSNSEHERASAALEAAKVFASGELVVIAKEDLDRLSSASKSKKPRKPRAPRPSRAPRREPPPAPKKDEHEVGSWVPSKAARDTFCSLPDCGEPIEKGDPVWMRINAFAVEYVHRDGVCGF